jgi:hypothetical protein
MGENPAFYSNKKWLLFLQKDFYWVFKATLKWLPEVGREGKLTTHGWSFPNI